MEYFLVKGTVCLDFMYLMARHRPKPYKAFKKLAVYHIFWTIRKKI